MGAPLMWMPEAVAPLAPSKSGTGCLIFACPAYTYLYPEIDEFLATVMETVL
jgi:hypothetical protein